MRIAIIGASGLVGYNCQRYFKEQGIDVLGTHFNYPTPDTQFYDTLHPENAENYNIKSFAPTHILHAGALTHVDYCEEYPEESYKQTVQSTINTIGLAKELSAQIIYISTDYIFDGKSGPYAENDTVNPISVYGKHKLEAEELIKAESSHLILRITNVYGHEPRGKNFVARLVKAAKEQVPSEYKLPIDQYATPVNALDVAKALHLLLNDGQTGVYHIASTDYLNRVQLAIKVLSYFHVHKVSLVPVSTAELGQPALRPLQGGLKTGKFNAQYPGFLTTSLDEYLLQTV